MPIHSHLDALTKLDVAKLASLPRPEQEILLALGRTHLALGEAYASLADTDDAALRAEVTDAELKIRELRAALSKLPRPRGTDVDRWPPAPAEAEAARRVAIAQHAQMQAATEEARRRVTTPPTNLDPAWVCTNESCRRGTETLRFASCADDRFIAVVRLDAMGRELWRTELEYALRSGEYLLSQGTRFRGVDRAGRVAIDTEAEHSRGGTSHWTTRWLLDLATGAVLSRECAGT